MRLSSAPSRHLPFAVLLLLAGALLRVAGLFHPPSLDIDEARYLVTAHHVAAQVGYSDWRGPQTHIHPAHPLLTAALAGSGIEGLEAAGRLATCVGATLCLIPLALLADRLGGRLAALLALALLAFHPVLARNASTIAPEGMYVLFTGGALLTLLPRADIPLPRWRWALAGGLFGAAYLARPEGLPVGILAGGVAAACFPGPARRRVEGWIVFLLVMLAPASPFLIFIHRVTGSWSLTGKTLELFFIGQGLRETGGAPPDAMRLRELEAQWRGVLPYLAAHPRETAQAALLNGRGVFGRILPSQVGLAGLPGLLAWLAAAWRDAALRRRTLLLLAPCLTLLLMLLTFPNQRVVSSVLPFLLILSAIGWARLAQVTTLSSRATLALLLAILVLGAALGWGRTLGRLRGVMDFAAEAPERVAARKALTRQPDPARIVSNDPVLSFYIGDPSLFGPPGHYAPLSGRTCSDLTGELGGRQASVAILTGSATLPADALASNSPRCPLREIFRTTRSQARPLQVLTLEPTGAPR